jgi:hypothetical protein
LADQNDDGEHRRVPLFLEGDDPVDIDESAEQRIDDDAGAAQGSRFACGGGVGGEVLLERPAAEPASHPDGNGEEDDSAGNEHPGVLICMSLLQDGLLCHLGRLSPWVNKSQSEQDGDKKNEHERQIHEGRFKKAARRITPAPAGELMNHGHHETTERQADPKEPGEKVGKIKLLFVQDDAESGEAQREQAQHQGDELNSVKA